MRHTCALRFSYAHARARAIAAALAPEAAQSEVPKTRGDVRADGDALLVDIMAEDLPSLRAAVNSHLRWIDAAEKAARVGER
jgi:tRNA threonylcarbamoyladenosine modification (KEOPS) complex  Pcc1 subunit